MSKLTNRKKRARAIRPEKGEYFRGQKKGSKSTHLMEHGSFEYKNKRGKNKTAYSVTPSIGYDASKPKGSRYYEQSYKEARDKGEEFIFKNKKRAEKFSAGSWKKGKAKREAMKAYRSKKKK
jgi:hypothetical protein